MPAVPVYDRAAGLGIDDDLGRQVTPKGGFPPLLPVDQGAFGRVPQPQDKLMDEIEDTQLDQPELDEIFAFVAVDQAWPRQLRQRAGL